MSVQYRPASEAARLAGDLIAQFHEHLIGVRIEYVFRSKAKKGAGKVVLGTARKISGLSAWLASPDLEEVFVDPDPFFVIEFAEDEWGDLNDRQRAALVDHELSHCWAELDDGGGLQVVDEAA